ncbi:MAG: GNAT family N-acetyltransferase [Pseudomonadota bacterium]
MVKNRIEQGWAPGLVGWTVACHGRHYAEHWGFGAVFEGLVAEGMGAFVQRLAPPGTQIFWAGDAAGYLGTVSVDAGEAEAGLAHLRWFFVDPRARGQGLGQRLMAEALAAARDAGMAGLYLDTFAGLDAARAVYEKAGFGLVAEREAETWGMPVREQRFELRF